MWQWKTVLVKVVLWNGSAIPWTGIVGVEIIWCWVQSESYERGHLRISKPLKFNLIDFGLEFKLKPLWQRTNFCQNKFWPRTNISDALSDGGKNFSLGTLNEKRAKIVHMNMVFSFSCKLFGRTMCNQNHTRGALVGIVEKKENPPKKKKKLSLWMLWLQAAQKIFIYFSCRLVSDIEIFIELEPGEVLQIVSCFWTAQMLWFLPNRKKIYPTKPTLRIRYRAQSTLWHDRKIWLWSPQGSKVPPKRSD